jgi:flagellar basal body-associated protein FliL
MAEISGNEDLRCKPDENVIRLRFKPDTPNKGTERRTVMQKNDRANSSAWIVLAVGCATLLIVAVGAFVIYGVPGTTGGTSPSQQQTSGAPQPTNEIRDGHTRQNTTGYGAKEKQP